MRKFLLALALVAFPAQAQVTVGVIDAGVVNRPNVETLGQTDNPTKFQQRRSCSGPHGSSVQYPVK